MILRSYQSEAIDSIFKYFYENESGHCLLACPTGVGKSLIIAEFIRRVLEYWPNQRILQLVHTKELVEQNSKTLLKIWPLAPIGVFCAGLNSKETAHSVIFGSLGSVRNNIEAFGHRDLILLDEAHSLSPDESTGYQKIIAGLTKINPAIRVIGLSATIFRLGQGLLTDNGFFTDVCFDITGVNAFNRLIAEGFLAPLIVPSKLKTQLDVSQVSISQGDFNQGKLQKAVDKQEITHNAIAEAINLAYDRNCWLVFASGIEHSEHVAGMLQSFGISAVAVHSKISDDERDERILEYKEGKIKALVGYKIFTTGFNHPPIDVIIDLYPTCSPGLHVQKIGRGTRPYDGSNPNFDYIKKNCLVLDFSGNTKRLGPINDPVIPKKKGDKTGEAPIKICDNCGFYNHASARYCGGKPYATSEGCGTEFIFKTKIVQNAGTDAILRGDMPTIETFKVSKVIYNKHVKTGGFYPSIKVSYYCGLQRFTEWICPEHKGYARTKFKNWWNQRHSSEAPQTVDDVLVYSSQLRCPSLIHVRTDLNYKEIVGVEW